MERYATLNDVARLANTSIATASYVINGGTGRYVSDSLRKRVLKAANELHYVKSNEAATLRRSGSRKIVAVLIPQPQNQFFLDILTSCNETLSAHGYETIIGFTMDDPAKEKSLIQQMIEKRVDGIIISPTNGANEILDLVQKLGISLVVLSRPMSNLSTASSVRLHNYNCGYKGMEYLVSLGHTHVGFVGWNSVVADGASRIKACMDVYDAYGIPKDYLHVVKGAFNANSGYEITKSLLEGYPDTTAIFFGYHVLALGGLRYLKDKNIHVPKDISVIIYGHPLWVSAGENDYSYIEMFPEEIGTKAAELLYSIMKSGNTIEPTHIIIEGMLYQGSSVRRI